MKNSEKSMLASDLLLNISKISVRKLLAKCNISNAQSSKFMSELEGSCELSFEKYLEKLNSLTGIYTKDKTYSGVYDIAMMISDYENYYDFVNSLTFICSQDKIKNHTDRLPDDMVNLIDKFYKMYSYEGIVVNIEDRHGICDICVKLSKCDFKVKRKQTGICYDVYGINVCLVDCNSNRVEPFCIRYIPELYPRLFVDVVNVSEWEGLMGINMYNCMECEYSGSIDGIHDMKLYILSYRARNTDKIVSGDSGMYIEEILNALYYCLNRFMNRKMVYKEGDSNEAGNIRISGNKEAGGDIRIKDSKTHRIVSLRDIVNSSKKPGNSNNHTHKSPCEHRRRGYWRKCKSGKVVWINETIVNKGKQKAIYKV